MTTFNILGCCVTRDIFSMHKNDGGYKINQYVNEFSPLFALDYGLDVDYNIYNSIDISSICSNFIKRCTYLDVTKNIFNYINKKNSDYLILDMGPIRIGYIVFENGVRCYGGGFSKKVINSMIDRKVFPPIYEYLNYNYMSLREVEERIIKYCAEIKKYYPVEKIILNELLHAFLLFDKKNKKIIPFKNSYELNQKNIFMSQVFEIMKRELNGCHIIYMPHNM